MPICSKCGRRTYGTNKICNSCYLEDYDEQGISGETQKHANAQWLTDHRQRLTEVAKRIKAEEAEMKRQGLDPVKD